MMSDDAGLQIRTIAKNCEAEQIRFAQNEYGFASLSLRNFLKAFDFEIFLDCEFAITSHLKFIDFFVILKKNLRFASQKKK